MDADSEVKGDEAKDDSSEKEKSAETDQEDKEMVVVVEDTFFKGFDKQSQMSEVKLSPESLIEKLSESEPKEKASRGRKRKAADLKSGDENENEDTLKDEHSEDGKQNDDSVKEKKSKQKNENSDVESTEDKDLNLPSKDILGKGKRQGYLINVIVTLCCQPDLSPQRMDL
nr:unnamed protein product [Callosobruchus chinensis]